MKFFDFHHHHADFRRGIYDMNPNSPIPNGLFSAGIHPMLVGGDLTDLWHWFAEIVQHPRCTAIGECGLDPRAEGNLQEQEKVFLQQLSVANDLGKPVIIHCVRRFQEVIRLRKKVNVPCVIHGFNRSATLGNDLLNHHFYLSFGKSLLHKVHLQDLVKQMPLNRLLLESDNADTDIGSLYSFVAKQRNIQTDELCMAIEQNLVNLNIPNL